MYFQFRVWEVYEGAIETLDCTVYRVQCTPTVTHHQIHIPPPLPSVRQLIPHSPIMIFWLLPKTTGICIGLYLPQWHQLLDSVNYLSVFLCH
jgi:hypothetical protein